MSDNISVPIESAFHFCPRCGKPNDNPGAIPFQCSKCEMAMYFGPVAAVGALVVNDQNEILLVRRARDPGKGCWGLPGGFVDRDETIEEALQREVIEETQLQIASKTLLVTFPNKYDYHGVVAPVIDLFYVCKAIDASTIELAVDELDHFEWVWPTKEHLQNMAFVSNRRAIELWMTQ